MIPDVNKITKMAKAPIPADCVCSSNRWKPELELVSASTLEALLVRKMLAKAARSAVENVDELPPMCSGQIEVVDATMLQR